MKNFKVEKKKITNFFDKYKKYFPRQKLFPDKVKSNL